MDVAGIEMIHTCMLGGETFWRIEEIAPGVAQQLGHERIHVYYHTCFGIEDQDSVLGRLKQTTVPGFGVYTRLSRPRALPRVGGWCLAL